MRLFASYGKRPSFTNRLCSFEAFLCDTTASHGKGPNLLSMRCTTQLLFKRRGHNLKRPRGMSVPLYVRRHPSVREHNTDNHPSTGSASQFGVDAQQKTEFPPPRLRFSHAPDSIEFLLTLLQLQRKTIRCPSHRGFNTRSQLR